jgi:Avidin family
MLKSKKELARLGAKALAALDLRGDWVNELGSKMSIVKVSKGIISGSYESAVSDDGTSVKGRLAGGVAGDTVGFIVNWQPAFDSVTSWSGKVLVAGDGSHHIFTLWQLSRGVPDESDWWQSFLAGSDTFWRLGPT